MAIPITPGHDPAHHKQIDPLKFARVLWPDVTFYREQKEAIYSVVENDETVIVAAHMTGKDFMAAFLTLYFFLTRHPCRIITTSADHYQLESVLWGEIRRFLSTSVVPLVNTRDDPQAPLLVNHLHLRKVVNLNTADGGSGVARNGDPGTELCPLSYVLGRVAARGEGMQGHHIADVGDGIPRTLWICDEASGVDDRNYDAADTWAHRKLIVGNPYPPRGGANFFKKAVQTGNKEVNKIKIDGGGN